MSGWPAPIAYLTSDFLPVIVLAAAALAAMQFETATDGALGRRLRHAAASLDPHAARLYGDVAIAATAIVVVVLSTPALRFANVIVGDEPKYLRFCELWLQGRGMNLEGIQDRSALAATERTRLVASMTAAVPALRADLAGLAADARRLARGRGWSRRYNVSVYTGSSIITGRNGGFYQWHSPGISALILPAYALDRWLFDSRTGRFADDLFCVNLAFLAMFAAVAVAAWRLARLVAPPAVAAAAALGVVLSLPVAAFAFQFYPEMMGALIVCVLCLYLVAPAPLRLGRALAIGLLLGALSWMHVRYAPMAAVAFGWFVWTYRRDARRAAVTVAAFAALSAMLCLYAYHVTGSVLPSAFYQSQDGPLQFTARLIPWGTLGEFFDRDFGLLPIAPVYLLAFGGLGVMLRRDRRAAFIAISLGLALFLPTGGHGVEVAGTTPGRFEMAVLPIAALPIASWLRAGRARPLMLTASLLLIAVSIANAVAHDAINHKTTVVMMAAGRSGWNPALLFPLVHSLHWIPTAFDRVSLVAWIAACATLTAWGAAIDEHAPTGALTPRRVAAAAAACLAALAAVGVVAILAGAPARDPRFTVRPGVPDASTATPATAEFLPPPRPAPRLRSRR